MSLSDLEDKSQVPKHFRIMRETPIFTRRVSSSNILQRRWSITAGDRSVADILVFEPPLFQEDHHISTAVNTLTVTNADSVVSVVEEVEPLFSTPLMAFPVQ